MAGVLRVISNAELMEQEQAEAEERNRALQREEFESSLAGHIRRAWETNKQAKRDVEQRLLKCLRARNGEYDPEVLAEIRKQGGSEIFMMLTATKCRAGAAWIQDILMPAGDKAWGIEPTPIPDIPPEAMQIIYQRIAQEFEGQEIAQEQFDQIAEKAEGLFKRKVEEKAKDAAERMETKIEDQLAEGKWEQALEEFVDDFATFPAAILKGPVKRRRPRLQWAEGFIPEQTTEVVSEFDRVSPFDAYPSPDATDINEGDFIEHIRFSRSRLYNLIGVQGYKEDAIRAVLQEYGRGGLREWLWTDTERAKLEGRGDNWRVNNNGLIDGLHFWGSAQGLMLLEWGVPPEYIEDPLGEYDIDAILVGRHVIRCVVNNDPLARRPYHKASYQNVPGSWWGTCPPELMEDIQRMCNATARALANNMGIASGPQVVTKNDLLADGEEVTKMYPWKVWQMKTDGVSGAQGQPIHFFQPQSNAHELLGVYEKFERMADDATNIPRYSYGSEKVGGAGRTASGLSMLMESASKGIRSAIKHIDNGVIRPAIEMQWFENMLYDPDPAIKGDAKVVTKGSTVLVAKDQAQMRRAELLEATNNPTDMRILGIEGRADMLRQVFKAADMPDILPDREELKQRLAQEQQQPNPDMLEEERKRQELEQEAQLEREEGEREERIADKEMQTEKEIALMRERGVGRWG